MSVNPLGEHTAHPVAYDPSVLFPIPRHVARARLGLDEAIPMQGIDHWHAYELSWLNERGKPQVAVGEFVFPADSANIVESKSLKLYLNSLNQEKFTGRQELIAVLKQDLSALTRSAVEILVRDVDRLPAENAGVQGQTLDGEDISVEVFHPDAGLLVVAEESIRDAALYSDLFRSTCPVTGQPDWARVSVRYSGRHVQPASLLRYLCSYREHQGYHEECCERIYRDLYRALEPEQLFIAMNFLRRGGLDINVYRSSEPVQTEQILPRTRRQ